jgi:hypothetical protein
VTRPWKARCTQRSWEFIGDSSPAATVGGARRSPCKAESCTTAAGCILRTVKRYQAHYMPASHGVVLT